MKYEELDEIDRRILKILQQNSNLTVKELASRINLSVSPTFERQKRLEREGFIKGYHAILDAKKTGNGITVLCNMRLKQHSQLLMDDFMDAIQTRDMDSYQEFMRKKLGNIESVGYFHSIFAMKEVKNTHGVPVKIEN